MLARAGCDVCSDWGWDLLRSIVGIAEAASSKPRRTPQPGDPGMEGPIEARLSYYWGSQFKTTWWGEDLHPGEGTFENPWPVAVAAGRAGGRRWSSLPKDTKILIPDLNKWLIVKDRCPECTPGSPAYVGPVLGGRLNRGIMGEVRMDVFIPEDLGIKDIYIYHPPH